MKTQRNAHRAAAATLRRELRLEMLVNDEMEAA